MEQVDSQILTDSNSKETRQKKKISKQWRITLGIFVAIALIVTAIVLYVYLYKIPHDEAVKNFNEAVTNYNSAVDQFNAAATSLEERNKGLDESITSLGQVIYAENIPIDEFLLADAYSVLEEARNIPKDSPPAIPPMPNDTDAINIETSNILKLVPEVEALGDYSEMINLLSSTELKYQTMVEQFKRCETEVVWLGVDEEYNVLRFVVKINNANAYTLRGVTTEWIAYDRNGAIVGSYDGSQPDIPANGYIYYVGGAGSANLSGTPTRIEIKITTEGLLTNRELPQISVSNIQIENHGFNWFTVSADCTTDSDINTADLDGQIIVKNADGEILDADFWSAENLPDSIDANGKFILSADFFDLSAMPTDAEVFMYYVLQ